MNADKRRRQLLALILVCVIAGGAQAQGQNPSERVAAIVRLKKVVAEHPENAQARVDLGNALDDNGDSAGAVTQYREAIRVNPKFAPAYRNLALAHIRQGQWAAAESAARDAVRIEPAYVQARCDLAVALGSQRKTDDAAREWRQAIGRDKAAVARYWAIDRAAAQQLEFSRAAPELAAQWLVALTLHSSGDRAAAIRQAEKIFETDRNFALAYFTLAELYAETGKSKESSAALQKATELNPALAAEFAETPADKISAEQKQLADAQRQEFNVYREMIPTLIAALRTKGLREEQRTKSRALLQEAAVRVKKLLDGGWEEAEGFVLLGDALRELQEPRAAWAYESAIRAARGKEANHAGRAWLGLGLLQSRAGRDAAAMEMFSQGLVITPDDPELLNAAAWLAATSADASVRNPQKAVEWAKKAAEATKEKNAAHMSTLAEAYFASGQMQAALRAISVAIALEPEETKYRTQFEKFQQAAAR
jgi:tetratricopeptide (TPR) repeat protein